MSNVRQRPISRQRQVALSENGKLTSPTSQSLTSPPGDFSYESSGRDVEPTTSELAAAFLSLDHHTSRFLPTDAHASEPNGATHSDADQTTTALLAQSSFSAAHSQNNILHAVAQMHNQRLAPAAVLHSPPQVNGHGLDERRKKRLERNRVAAKECRMKRKRYLEEMEELNNNLKQENMMLRDEIARLRVLLGWSGGGNSNDMMLEVGKSRPQGHIVEMEEEEEEEEGHGTDAAMQEAMVASLVAAQTESGDKQGVDMSAWYTSPPSNRKKLKH